VEVAPPPARIARDPEVAAAAAGVVKLHGENACGQGVEGTGFLYSPTRIMTNAHVVAGVTSPRVVAEDGQETETEVVYFDPDIDVAVLAVADLEAPHLSFDLGGRPSQVGAVLGFPQDGPYDVQPARIRAQQRLRSPNIHNEGRSCARCSRSGR
jgi:S1-C subfamily serine protease